MTLIRAICDSMLNQATQTLLSTETTEHGESLDTLYDKAHISAGTLTDLRDDICQFVHDVIDLEDDKTVPHAVATAAWNLVHDDPEQAGHDFIMSRNGHGVGFWDRGTGEAGENLHTMAENLGAFTLYVDEDGYLYR